MRIVLAPDSFKGTIGAAAAARALARGWLAERPGDQVRELPLADGGEGTLDVLAAARPGSRWHRARVTGPGGDPVTAPWLELADGTHVIELARASGLPLLAGPRPLTAQTTGTGELIGLALDAGAARILIGLGGSAATDGGTGALTALGAEFLGPDGAPLPPGGGPLARLAAADLSRLRPPPAGGAACLTDVRAPLLGPGGAAAVFGPQKGAGPAEIRELEAGLAALAAALDGEPAAAGAGAAGGTGYGLALWGAELADGAARLAEAAGLAAELARADLVITGEGRFDPTSTQGKVTGAVCAAARRAGVPAALVVGQVAALAPDGVVAVADLSRLAAGPAGGQDRGADAARAEPARWLTEAGRRLAAGHGRRAPAAGW